MVMRPKEQVLESPSYEEAQEFQCLKIYKEKELESLPQEALEVLGELKG